MNAPPGSDAGAAIGCLLCGFLAAATGAIAVYLVLSPSGAMFAGTAVEAATVAKYYKAFVIIMGPWAAKICGQKVLNK